MGIDYHLCYKIDQGNFWGWQSEHDGWQSGWLDRRSNSTSGDRFQHSLWTLSWYGVRKCNIGLENLHLLTNATTEERNIIEGQLYFFRAWFHFQWIQYLGGLPYIDEVLPADQKFSLPRLSYAECAEKAAADFRRAADLLPIDWDNTTVGKRTLGKNQLRINKIMALGYLGKNLLWAGSPLMNYSVTGNRSYNQDFCRRAAEAFGELLTLVESGQTQYSLVNFANYSDLFYTNGQNALMPGSTEAIFRGPSYGWHDPNWGQSKQYGTKVITQSGVTSLPTANYVNYYGMANGLPLSATGSGFSTTQPWKDRDPRFYHDIIYDGAKIVEGTITPVPAEYVTPAEKEAYDHMVRYAGLHTDGHLRNVIDGSRTGYLLYKFIPVKCNQWDDGYGWSNKNHMHLSWMRLADVYLMYAESAAVASNSATGKSTNCSLTAEDAVNKIRTRAGVASVDSRYTSSFDGFMSELQRERAVELAFEGHRFNDLRRWLLIDKAPYNIKTSQEFTRNVFDKDTPMDNTVSGFSEKVILTRNFTETHYWLPLKRSDVSIYPELQQNPGW